MTAQGLGIMIIEGSHKATGTGIFVSDIQERSAAAHVSNRRRSRNKESRRKQSISLNICVFQSGLKVGDMILAINTETFLQISYDEVGPGIT